MFERHYIVEFTENGAKIYKDPIIIEQKKNQDNVLLNPELPIGVSPSFWKKDNDNIAIISFDDAKNVLKITKTNNLKANIIKSKLEKRQMFLPFKQEIDAGNVIIEKEQTSNISIPIYLSIILISGIIGYFIKKYIG